MNFTVHRNLTDICLLSNCNYWCFEQALLSAIINRIKGFIKLRIALGTLHAALPDATTEELRAYDDECAICRVCQFAELCLSDSSWYC